MRLRVGPLAAGFAVAALVAGFPASAADQTVNAVGTSWDKPSVSIDPGDTVTWNNSSTLIMHNICVAKPGDTPTASGGCTEFRNGDPATNWTASHAFPTAGSYSFICQFHPTTMTGTITVGSSGTTTTTTSTGTTTTTTSTTTTTTTTTTTGTTPAPGAQPTDTTTPTQTQQASADATAPAFAGKLQLRAGGRSLVLDIGSSEDATLHATVFRRRPHDRTFRRLGTATVKVKAGRNLVTVPRKAGGRLTTGSYRVKVQLVDAAGNKSLTRTLK